MAVRRILLFALVSTAVAAWAAPAPAAPVRPLVLTQQQSTTAAYVGDTITVTFTLRNDGATTLTGLTFWDHLMDCEGLDVTELAPAAETTVVCTHVFEHADRPTWNNIAYADSAETDAVYSESTPVSVTVPPVTSLSVWLTTPRGTVRPGDTIPFDVHVSNPGDTPLTQVAVDRPLGCPPPPAPQALAPGASFRLGCSYRTRMADVPEVTWVATATSAETGAVESDPMPVSVRVRRIDALVRIGNGRFLGNDRYGVTGRQQQFTASVARGGRLSLVLRGQNDGSHNEWLHVLGAGQTPGWRITYRYGSADVTRAVNRGTYDFPGPVGPGAVRNLVINVRPGPNVARGDQAWLMLTVDDKYLDRYDTRRFDNVLVKVTRR